MRIQSLIVSLVVGSAFAASAAPTAGSDRPKLSSWLGNQYSSPLGLLDPSRLDIDHSLSFGIATGSGGSLFQSLYATRFNYKLSDPLTLSLLLGVQNSKFSTQPYYGSQTNLLGGFRLDYRPTSDFHLRFEMIESPYRIRSLGDRWDK